MLGGAADEAVTGHEQWRDTFSPPPTKKTPAPSETHFRLIWASTMDLSDMSSILCYLCHPIEYLN